MTEKNEIIPSNDFRLFSVDSAIILTIVSAFAYVSTFTYEDSYCKEFGIPSEYISIDLNTIIPFGTKMVLGTITIIFIIKAFSNLKVDFLQRNKTLHLFVKNNLVSLLTYLIVTFTIMSSFKYKFYLYLLIAIITNMASFFHIRSENWKKKDLQNDSDLIQSKRPRTAIEYRKGLYSVIISASIAFLVFSNAKGISDAKTQSDFYVISGSPEKVVIRKYGEEIICINYDYKLNKFSKKISIFKIGDAKPMDLEIKHLSPLLNSFPY